MRNKWIEQQNEQKRSNETCGEILESIHSKIRLSQEEKNQQSFLI